MEIDHNACSQQRSAAFADDVLSSIASSNGFTIHDVPADGNCLFSAIAYQLASIGMTQIPLELAKSSCTI